MRAQASRLSRPAIGRPDACLYDMSMRRLEEKPVTRQLPEAEQVMRLYAEAFPDEERIPESELWQMACREQVEFTAYYDVGTFCGFTFCIDAGCYLYIVYLAVDAQARAKGYGSRVLAQLRERHPHATFVLEIEPLDEDAPNLHQRIKRLAFYEQHAELIERRDDLVLEHATLLNMLGRYEEAKALIDNRIFHPWEGGEGKVSGQYQMCRLEIAKQLLQKNANDARAKQLLEECLVFPHHLGEGKLYGSQDNDFLYFLGRYQEGTAGPTEPVAAMYYNDAKPDKIFYAALCYRKLGQEDKARSLFHKLINYGKQHIFDHVVMDYFAVSLPDLLVWEGDLDELNRIHCLYMLALGYYGMGEHEKALKYLEEVEKLDNNHQGIQQFRSLINTSKK